MVVASVVLRDEAYDGQPEVRAIALEPQIVVDRQLQHGGGEAGVVPPQPESRLARRLGTRVGERCEQAELHDAAVPLEPRQLAQQVVTVEAPGAHQ